MEWWKWKREIQDFCIEKSKKRRGDTIYLDLFCNKINSFCNIDNCPNLLPAIQTSKKCHPPKIAGNRYIKGGDDFRYITPKQMEAYKLRLKGLSFKDIGLKIGIKKSNAYELYKKAYQKMGGDDKLPHITPNSQHTKKHITYKYPIEIHNDSISIERDLK